MRAMASVIVLGFCGCSGEVVDIVDGTAGASTSTCNAGGNGGTGGVHSTGIGGSGGDGNVGGFGGATTSSAGGTGGTCEVYQCGAKDCGIVSNGCGMTTDCGSCNEQNNPMQCGLAHTCECPAEGNSPEAMALCQGPAAEPAVDAFCVTNGGCNTAICGGAPNPKVPTECILGGALKPVVQDPNTWINIWCCAASQM